MSAPQYVLGVSMSNHDRSACLLRDGHMVAAVSEERLDRRKSSEGFYRRNGREIVLPPVRAITAVLRQAGIGLDDVAAVACGRSVRLVRDELLSMLPIDPTRLVEPPLPAHHLAHAYSAYATAPFDSMALLVVDEQGHWQNGRFERCSWFTGDGDPLKPRRTFWGSDSALSLGMFYNVCTAMVSLSEAGRPAAGKLMSLAAYGKPRADWPPLLELSPDGDVGMSLDGIDAFLALAGVQPQPGMASFSPRRLDDLLAKYVPLHWRSTLAADLAYKAQAELEAAILHVADSLRQETCERYLAFAGGVALNCVSNARLSEVGWEDVHIHPAATDDGTAVGLATYAWMEILGGSRQPVRAFAPFTGPSYDRGACRAALARYGLAGYARPALTGDVAALIAGGDIVCRFVGRSEWGPRALGHRSIVANPLLPGMVERINSTVKHREAFRPFGLSLTTEAADLLLDRGKAPVGLDAYMLSVARARDARLAPVVHVDGTVRYQLVSAEVQPNWHELIRAVGAITGLEVVLNTSFNTAGEPLVETPDDAVRQFLLSGADTLVLEDSVVRLSDVPAEDLREARREAWQASRLDPLTVAAGLESAGYPAAAQQTLNERGISAEQLAGRGSAALRSYHALCQRIAEGLQDSSAAMNSARRLLETWQLPSDVVRGAAAVARGDGDNAAVLSARLLLAASQQPSVAQFLAALLTKDRHASL